jgi:GNAT superfamily N-acetyltransferase
MNSTTATGVTVEPIVVPASLDSPEAAEFLAAHELSNAAALDEAGHDGLREEAQERLGRMQDETDWLHVGLLARRDGEPIAAAWITISTQPGTALLEADFAIDPRHRGLGADAALAVEVERIARERGLPTIQTWTIHRGTETGAKISSPTGAGSIPADDPSTRFLLAEGFELGQVERTSVFDLRADLAPVARALTAATDVAGPDYRLVTWTAPTPERLLEGYAHVLSRMSTDTPQGETVVEEQHWDADRVRRRDARQAAQGLTSSVAAVVHVPTGTLVAFNELTIGADPSATTQQDGTLVLREHRGHRLGMIVKCANILRWPQLAPESPRIVTFNAEENRPMLDINEALGFQPISYAAAWKKVLA